MKWLNEILDTETTEPEADPSFSLAGAERLAVACIATDLNPRVERHLQCGSRAMIVGYDGPNIEKLEYPWRDILSEWLDRGCDVDYLLINPSGQTLEHLKALSQAAGKPGRGHLRAFRQIKEPAPESPDACYLPQWQTRHFAAFENPRQLWIENNHPGGQTDAEDCYYMKPEVAERSSLWDMCKSRFEHVIDHYCEQVA